jgi:hypothetical protein
LDDHRPLILLTPELADPLTIGNHVIVVVPSADLIHHRNTAADLY